MALASIALASMSWRLNPIWRFKDERKQGWSLTLWGRFQSNSPFAWKGRGWTSPNIRPTIQKGMHINHHLLSPLIAKRRKEGGDSSHTEALSHVCVNGKLHRCHLLLPPLRTHNGRGPWPRSGWSLFIVLFHGCVDKRKQSENVITSPFSAPATIIFWAIP